MELVAFIFHSFKLLFMRRGSILILILGVILVVNALTISFLHMIEGEVNYINQIDPCTDFRVKSDSVLSITIANLYSYLEGEFNLSDCRKKIENCIEENFGENVNFALSTEDNKIPLKPEFLALLEQLFLAIDVPSQDTMVLVCELEDFFSTNKLNLSKPEQLLALPAFKRLFVDKNGFFTGKWQFFTKNVTCRDTENIALHELSDELLSAICSLENWRFGDVKDAINQVQSLDINSQNNVFVELLARGCTVHNSGVFKDKNSCFNLTITSEIEGVRLVGNYFIKYNILCDLYGFPFEIISLTNKL